MPMPLCVYITCSSREEAERIGAALVDARLAACANVLAGGVRSRYWWNGAVEEADEVILIAKTMEDRFAELNREVRRLHSYETPCVAAWPIVMGDPDYLAWVEASTRSA